MLVSVVLFAQLLEGRSDAANNLEEVCLQLHARIQAWSQQAFRQAVCAPCLSIFQRDAGPVLLCPCIERRIEPIAFERHDLLEPCERVRCRGMSERAGVANAPRRQDNNSSHRPHPYRRTCGRRRLDLSWLVVSTTTVLSTGRFGASVLVKCPTATGSLAGNVCFNPSSRSSSKCRFSSPSFDLPMRTSIVSNASAWVTSSGSSPSRLPAAHCRRSHASFSDGPPGTSAMINSEMCGGARPSSTTLRRLPAATRNIGQSRSFGSAGFFGSA